MNITFTFLLLCLTTPVMAHHSPFPKRLGTGLETQVVVSPPIWDRKESHQLLLAAQYATWLRPHFCGLFSPACLSSDTFFFCLLAAHLTLFLPCGILPCLYTQGRRCGFPLSCLALGTESFLGFSGFSSWLFSTIILGRCLLKIRSNSLSPSLDLSTGQTGQTLKLNFSLFSPNEDEVNLIRNFR